MKKIIAFIFMFSCVAVFAEMELAIPINGAKTSMYSYATEKLNNSDTTLIDESGREAKLNYANGAFYFIADQDTILENCELLAAYENNDSTEIMLFVDENENMQYLNLNTCKVTDVFTFSDIRKFKSNKKYYYALNKSLNYDIYDIEKKEKISLIKPATIITGTALMYDSILVVPHMNGLSAYNVFSSAKIWDAEINNILKNTLHKGNDSSFIFLTEEDIFHVDLFTGNVLMHVPIQNVTEKPYYLLRENFDFIILEEDKIIHDGAGDGRYDIYELEDAEKYELLYKEEDYLRLIKDKVHYNYYFDEKVSPRIEIAKDVEPATGDEPTKQLSGVNREPDINWKEFSANLEYPDYARENNIESKLFMRTLYNKKGMAQFCYLEDVTGNYDKKALLDFFISSALAIYKTNVTPAIVNGKPSVFWVNIPVNFKLQ